MRISKYLLASLFLLSFTFYELKAQLSPEGYVYRNSNCASGGNDYYFFANGKAVIAFAVGGKVYGANATMASWQKDGDKVIITKHYEKSTKPAPDAKAIMVAADTQYDKYVAQTNFFSDANETEILHLSYYEEGQGCEVKEQHGEKSAEDFFQNCLRVNNTQRVYPFTSERLLSKDELKKYNATQLRIMHHEILASYGYLFRDEQWRDYFNKKGIYGNIVDVDDFMSSIERQNIALLKPLVE